MPMPNRQIVGGEPYRYGYQGEFAETDPETGKPAFQLRLWDGRIGRWLTTDPYRQFNSLYLGMGNNPINGVDPDGGLFGRIRAWFYKQFNGGEIFKNDEGQWVWSRSFSQADFEGDDVVNLDGFDYKNFGYGGLGKINVTTTGKGYSKLDFGLVYANQGITGVDLKGPTVRLMDSEFGFDTGKGFVNDIYYVGKDGVLKGSLYSVQLESMKLDAKYSKTWEATLYPNGVIEGKTESSGGFGKPYLEAKVTELSKKGMKVHLGFQEDWGRSAGFFKVIGLSGKVGFRVQSKFEWEW